MWLEKEEVQQLTGAKQRRTMSRCLDRQGIPYVLDQDGWPKVLRSVVMAKCGGLTIPQEPRLHLG